MKLSNIFFKIIPAMHQITSIAIKWIRIYVQTRLNSVLAYLHYSNFNITFIVMNMPTTEVIMIISNIFFKIFPAMHQITPIVIKWIRIYLQTRLNSVLAFFHYSNFNITFIVMNMPTIEVIMELSNILFKIIPAMHQITSVSIKWIRIYVQTKLNSVFPYFHYSNFNITCIVMNIPTIEVMNKLSNIFLKIIFAIDQITSIAIKWIRTYVQTSLNSVLAYFHCSNFNITCIVMNMPTIEVILKISNMF